MSLRYVLLAVLSKEPNTGYGIGRLLRTDLAHIWQARLQQIYSELARAQAAGLVEAEVTFLPNRPAKKVYSLTKAGAAVLDDWLEQPPQVDSSRDDLLAKLYCWPRAAHGRLLHRLEERRDAMETRCRALRRRLEAGITSNDANDLGYLLTLDAALAWAEAQRAWCVRALASLRTGTLDGLGADGAPLDPPDEPTFRAAGAPP